MKDNTKNSKKICKNREEFRQGRGTIFLAGQNIYPWCRPLLALSISVGSHPEVPSPICYSRSFHDFINIFFFFQSVSDCKEENVGGESYVTGVLTEQGANTGKVADNIQSPQVGRNRWRHFEKKIYFKVIERGLNNSI